MKNYYGAWNRKSKLWVKWLGYSIDKKKMNKRIDKYCSPQITHILAKKIPYSSRWFKKKRRGTRRKSQTKHNTNLLKKTHAP